MTDNSGKLTEALATISKRVGSLRPDKKNKDQNYAYISADKILQRIGSEMASEGVSIIPGITEDSYEIVTYTSYGKEKSRVDARVTFMMEISHKGGESVSMPWVGYGTDYVTPDKALYKAITSGHKYFLMKLFNVGIGNEDGEHQPPQDEEAVVKQPRRKKPQRKREPKHNGDKPTQDNPDPSWMNDGGELPEDANTNWQKAGTMKEFARRFANYHPYYTSPQHVMGAVNKAFDKVPAFSSTDNEVYAEKLEEYAKAKADEEAESA